jgi:hypothetical protein
VTERRRGFSKPVAAFFFAATWIALIIAIIFGVDTDALVLHAIAAALGLAALVIAWRGPTDRPDDPH